MTTADLSRLPRHCAAAALLVLSTTVASAFMARATTVAHAATAADPAQAELDALRAQVRTLEDRDEIRQLILEYGHMLDAHDLVGYSNLFARDGEWIGGFGRARGPKAILALMRKYLGTTAPDPRKTTGFHLMTGILIHVHGDRATAESKLVFMYRSKDNRPVPVMGGHYDDTLIREDGQWKFLRRVVMMDIPYQDPRTIKGTPPPPPFPGR
ncbi:MAG: nuclear transport factor 2 family protein [Steroidobacteraceae bacterium]